MSDPSISIHLPLTNGAEIVAHAIALAQYVAADQESNGYTMVHAVTYLLNQFEEFDFSAAKRDGADIDTLHQSLVRVLEQVTHVL